MYRYFLALRWVLSRPINLLGMLGITLGVWALIVVVSIFSGYLLEVERHVVGGAADLSVIRIPEDWDWDDVEPILAADPNVAACAPRVVWYGMLHPVEAAERRAPIAGIESANGVPGADGRFVALLGVDPDDEFRVSNLPAWLRAVDAADLAVGDLNAPFAPIEDRPTMLVSVPRARAHGLATGATVRLSSAVLIESARGDDPPLDLIDAELRIGGAFETAYAGFDGLNVFVHIDTLRTLLGKAHGAGFVNEVVIRLHDRTRDIETRDRLARVLNAEVPPQYLPIIVRTSIEANAAELSSIEHQNSLMKLVLFVIMVVAAFLVFATLSMMVTEKTHDIGILTAMGATPRGVSMVFLSCGLVISLVGAALGVVVGCLSAIYTDAFNSQLRATFGIDLFPTQIYNLTHVPHHLDPQWILTVCAMAIVVGLVVSGIPAWRAARHDPLQSLRHE